MLSVMFWSIYLFKAMNYAHPILLFLSTPFLLQCIIVAITLSLWRPSFITTSPWSYILNQFLTVFSMSVPLSSFLLCPSLSLSLSMSLPSSFLLAPLSLSPLFSPSLPFCIFLHHSLSPSLPPTLSPSLVLSIPPSLSLFSLNTCYGLSFLSNTHSISLSFSLSVIPSIHSTIYIFPS